MARTKRKSKSDDEGKSKDTSPTVFTAAGLLAFSEEEALVKIKPVHVLMASIAFMLAVILTSIF